MDTYKDKYRQFLDKALQDVDPHDDAAIRTVFRRLRDANEKMLQKQPRLAQTADGQKLRELVEEVIAERASAARPARPEKPVPPAKTPPPASESPAGKPAQPTPRAAPRPRARSWLPPVAGFIAGLMLAVAGAVGAIFFGVADISMGAQAERKAVLEREYQRALPQLEAMLGYLARIEAEVQRRQREDPEGLESLAGERLVVVRQFDAALAAELPANQQRGTVVSLRATRDGYKILSNWILCRTAAVARPDLVDPRRAGEGLNCSHFGLWNEAGAGF